MKKLIYLFILLFVYTVFIQAQNISGKWTGYLDQNVGATNSRAYQTYYHRGLWAKNKVTHILTLTFIQEGEGIKGEYFVQTRTDTTEYAIFKLKGSIYQGNLNYKTTRKIDEVLKQSYGFCNNNAVLNYYIKDNYEYLEGEWVGWDNYGHSCASAHIMVRRIIDKPKVDTTSIIKEETVVHKQSIYKPIDTTSIIKKEAVVHKQSINGRHLDIQKTMNAYNDVITIGIWDNGEVDGDIISLYLNGELILEDFTLAKAKKEIPLHLKEGTNYLVMHAINLGSIPPNTAAMEINDGKKRKILTLVSDTKKSGAIEINNTLSK